MFGVQLERCHRKSDEEERRRKIKTLVAAELRNVAYGLIGARQFLLSYLGALDSGMTASSLHDLSTVIPRPMPSVSSLWTELLLLNDTEIDVLTVLVGNRSVIQDEIDAHSGAVILPGRARRLDGMIVHHMGLLAEAFELLAPSQRLTTPGLEAEPAADLLQHIASQTEYLGHWPPISGTAAS